jgi:hypothetical protein
LTLHSKNFRGCKAGTTFDAAKGCGHVQLKCEGELSAEVSFSISIGSESKRSVTRGPAQHDFSQSAVAALPTGQDVWNLFSAVDRKSETFMVTLEIALACPATAPIGASIGGA